MSAAPKPKPAVIDSQRITLAQTVLLAATYDQMAERSGAPRSEHVLSDAGLSHTEIAAAIGGSPEKIRSSIRRHQDKVEAEAKRSKTKRTNAVA